MKILFMKILVWIISICIGCVVFVAAIVMLGLMFDGYAQYNTQHDACLKRATSGYEIQQCH